MKKITFFIVACTLVASNQTMLGAAVASPADQLWSAANDGNVNEVRRILNTYGPEAYDRRHTVLGEEDGYKDGFIFSRDFFGGEAERGRNEQLKKVYFFGPTLAASIEKKLEEVRKAWEDYKNQLPARPTAVPAVAPQ